MATVTIKTPRLSAAQRAELEKGAGRAKSRGIVRPTGNQSEGIVGHQVEAGAREDIEHFYLCPHCGQAVDMRDLGQVMYHEARPHRPLPDDA